MSDYNRLFASLDASLSFFIKEVNNSKLSNMATDTWSVKDVLCHIVYWHNYYSHQYKEQAEGKKPFVFSSRGGSTRNQEGVVSLRGKSKKELIKTLNLSQESLRISITKEKIPGMNYTDRKYYKTPDFLDVVSEHIKRHAIQVRKAKEVHQTAR